MTKKIFALVMVVSVLGSIFVAGCKKDDDAAGTAGTAGATAGTAGKDAGTTTTGDTAGKTTS